MSFDSSRSSTSQGKKGNKRKSLESNSFNQSHSRKSLQKALGMAWGANSLSSSKSSTAKSPFSDFGSSMEEKNRKLRNQLDADASTSSLGDSNGRTDPFRGFAIFVDGFTFPSSQELLGYMLKHGRRFENYFSRHRMTRIMCSNMPNSKIKNLRSFSGGLPVVKPTWVLDSVAVNRVFDWVPYQLDQLVNGTCNQPKLSTFFSLKSNFISNDAEAPKMGEYIEHKRQLGEEPACHEDESSCECDIRMAEPKSTDLEDELSVREAFQSSDSSLHKPSTTIQESRVRKVQSASISCSGSLRISSMGAKQSDIMPASLSQVDVSVLQQLPEELKADILELLPEQRKTECSTEPPLGYTRKNRHDITGTKKIGISVDGLDLVSKDNLWMGSSPKWVEKFKMSNCLILNTFAELHYKSLPRSILSSTLQYAISSRLSIDVSSEEWDEAHRNFCELLEQYIDLKIESDIEEIYICFRLLKRLILVKTMEENCSFEMQRFWASKCSSRANVACSPCKSIPRFFPPAEGSAEPKNEMGINEHNPELHKCRFSVVR